MGEKIARGIGASERKASCLRVVTALVLLCLFFVLGECCGELGRVRD